MKKDIKLISVVLLSMVLGFVFGYVYIKVQEANCDEEIKKAAKAYNIPEEEFKEHIGGTDMIEYELQMRKAIEIIKK